MHNCNERVHWGSEFDSNFVTQGQILIPNEKYFDGSKIYSTYVHALFISLNNFVKCDNILN